MKPTIQYDDFVKLDMRIGLVIAVATPEWSRKLLQLTVDFGPEIGQKTILSGVRQWYSEADLLDKKFPFIVNLAERKMGEGVSQGMMMMADSHVDGELRAVALPVDQSIPVGSPLV